MSKIAMLSALIFLNIYTLSAQNTIQEISKFPNAGVFGSIGYYGDRAGNPGFVINTTSPFLIANESGNLLYYLDQSGRNIALQFLKRNQRIPYNNGIFTFSSNVSMITLLDSDYILSNGIIYRKDGAEKWNLQNSIPLTGGMQWLYPTVFENVIFISTESGYRSIQILNETEKGYEVLSVTETRALFAPGSTWPHPGLELDEKNRLIQNGIILTKDWDIFLDWMIEKNGTIKRGGHATNLGISTTDGIGLLEKDQPFNPLQMKGWGLPFRGRDSHGNWYWDRLVFTPEGTLIENLQPYLESLPQRGYQGGLSAMVHPNGDFFYLFHDKGVITLYKIENTWSPEAKIAYLEGLKKGLYKMPDPPATAYRAPNGTVLEDGVRVRWNPNTQEGTGINTSLKKGAVVQILARTQAKETIGGQEAYWYAVKTPEGVYGWSFGAFIQVPEPDKVMVGSGYFGPYQPPREW